MKHDAMAVLMDEEPPVTFVQADWSEAVEADLGRITSGQVDRGDMQRDLAAYKSLVDTEQAQLLAVRHEGETIGHVIWSTDAQPDGFDVVINAATVAPVAGIDVTAAIFDAFATLGKSTGARALRCFTKRPGMVRKCELLGAHVSYVLEVPLNGQ